MCLLQCLRHITFILRIALSSQDGCWSPSPHVCVPGSRMEDSQLTQPRVKSFFGSPNQDLAYVSLSTPVCRKGWETCFFQAHCCPQQYGFLQQEKKNWLVDQLPLPNLLCSLLALSPFIIRTYWWQVKQGQFWQSWTIRLCVHET